MAKPYGDTPPHNLEAEQAVLGCMLLDPDALACATNTLRPNDFYRDAHRVIFTAMRDLFERGEPVDLVTVANRLRDGDTFHDGDATYLASLPNATPVATNVDYYAGIVLEQSQRRAMIKAGEALTRLSRNGDSVESALIDIRGRLDLISARGGGDANSSLFTTAQTLTANTSATVPWRMEPYLADGTMTELDGKIKVGGKTTFALAMVRSILDGIPFMGRPTTRSPVVYLTEQSTASFTAALRRAGLTDRDDLHVLRSSDVMGKPWTGVASVAVRECEQRGAKVLIVDTLGRFANIPDDLENAAGAAQAAMDPLLRAASLGLAVLVLRHDRKSGGDVGESARGSTAFGGAMDVILSIRRSNDPQNTDPNIRELHALSRFDQTPPLVIVRLGVDGTYSLIGTVGEVEADQAAARLLSAVPLSEGDALSTGDLLNAARVKKTVGHELLERLHRDGKVSRCGAGRRGDPYRYYSSADSSAGDT